jgi:uroporphyrinogen-III synthase
VAALGTAVLPVGVIVACIGPSTAKTATDRLGRAPDVVSSEHTVDGLLAALEARFAFPSVG